MGYVIFIFLVKRYKIQHLHKKSKDFPSIKSFLSKKMVIFKKKAKLRPECVKIG